MVAVLISERFQPSEREPCAHLRSPSPRPRQPRPRSLCLGWPRPRFIDLESRAT